MGRFLFVVPPVADHVLPTTAVGRELAARGHRVAWAGHPDAVADVLPADALLLPVDLAVPRAIRRAVAVRATRSLRGPSALRSRWEEVLLPLARSMVPGVRTAVDEFAPDVVVADQQALAGGAVAQLLRVPWATTTTTAAEQAHPLGTMPLVARWIRGLLLDLMIDVGVPDDEAVAVDPRFSPHLVLSFTAEALAGRRPAGALDCGAGAVRAGRHELVGPCLDEHAGETPFAWTWLDGRPLVVVATRRPGAGIEAVAGRVADRFLRLAVEALAGMDVQAVVVAPDAAALPDLPSNVIVTPEVPSSALLALAAAVVTHGDHATVGRGLGHGVPLVVVPLHDDQPVVAQQVVDAGAGVRVRHGGLDVGRLRRAVDSALFDPGLRAGAAKVRDALSRAGGPRRAADRIEELMRTTTFTASTPMAAARETV
ncbi:MAG TPA: nucleotide disphospho-sugar-binding domain-containing protein [Acidimicrobiales bacterium]